MLKLCRASVKDIRERAEIFMAHASLKRYRLRFGFG